MPSFFHEKMKEAGFSEHGKYGDVGPQALQSMSKKTVISATFAGTGALRCNKPLQQRETSAVQKILCINTSKKDLMM